VPAGEGGMLYASGGRGQAENTKCDGGRTAPSALGASAGRSPNEEADADDAEEGTSGAASSMA
jgi:hypothetical protein